MEKKRVIINIFIGIVIIILAVYFYARYAEHSMLIVKEYRISNKEIPNSFSGIKIVHISDIYYNNTTDINSIENLVKKINVLKPDLIFFTGNMFSKTIKDEELLIKSFNKLDSVLGKYAVKGSFDYIEGYDSFMESIDFKVLNNEYELIYNEGLTPIFICGLTSMLKERTNLDSCFNYLDGLEEGVYNPTFEIVLANEGDVIENILNQEVKVNLILSGNSLNGSIVVPYYGPLFIPEGSKVYLGEYYKRDVTDIYVSSGVGTKEKYPYRMFNPPSFSFYRLKSLQ